MEQLIDTKLRGFEVVSRVSPDDINLPSRKTLWSAGYDISLPKKIDFEKTPLQHIGDTITIDPGEITPRIMLGIKSYMQPDEFCMLKIRSGMGAKGLQIMESGIIDADYYNNEDNEGEWGVSLRNVSKKPVEIKLGDRILQGIFMNYLTSKGDDAYGGGMSSVRKGGFGSTGK